jgi:hypothetical protein
VITFSKVTSPFTSGNSVFCAFTTSAGINNRARINFFILNSSFNYGAKISEGMLATKDVEQNMNELAQSRNQLDKREREFLP